MDRRLPGDFRRLIFSVKALRGGGTTAPWQSRPFISAANVHERISRSKESGASPLAPVNARGAAGVEASITDRQGRSQVG